MQNVFLSLIVICMYLSVFAVTIPVGFDAVYGLENTATWNTPGGFTINYPSDWLIDQYERTYGEGTWKIISFFNEQDTASINIDREFYPDIFFTLDKLYYMFDNPEKYDPTFDRSKVDNVFSFFIHLELDKILQCDYNYEEDYGCSDLKPKALRLFENDGGIPALQVEYSSASKSYGDNTTYGYSSLATIYYLQDRTIVLFSQSLLNDYEQLRPYFVEAANSFTLADNAEKKLSEKTKLRLLSDMKSFPNSDIAEIMNDALKQTKGYSIPIIEYGQISLETTEAKNSKGDAFTSISTLIQYDIPSWVKGVANFWAEGNISDSEFGEALSFLIDNEIIKVPKIQELQNEITQLKAENSELRTKLNLPKPAPEPIPQQESQISVQTDDSNKNEIGIDSDSPLLPNISITNTRIVNASGSEIDTVNVYQQIQVVADITNYNYFYQSFTFHMIIRETGYEEWFSGQFSGNQSFSPAVTWIPTEAGIFTAELSVFDNMQDKNKLTDSIILQIRVS